MHASAHFYFVGIKYKAWIWTPPHRDLVFEPGEYPAAVCEFEPGDGKVASYGQEAVGFGPFNRRKNEFICERGDGQRGGRIKK